MGEMFTSSRDMAGLRVWINQSNFEDFDNLYATLVVNKDGGRFEKDDYEFRDDEQGGLVLLRFFIATFEEGDVLLVRQFDTDQKTLNFDGEGWRWGQEESLTAVYKPNNWTSVRSFGSDRR